MLFVFFLEVLLHVIPLCLLWKALAKRTAPSFHELWYVATARNQLALQFGSLRSYDMYICIFTLYNILIIIYIYYMHDIKYKICKYIHTYICFCVCVCVRQHLSVLRSRHLIFFKVFNFETFWTVRLWSNEQPISWSTSWILDAVEKGWQDTNAPKDKQGMDMIPSRKLIWKITMIGYISKLVRFSIVIR